MRSLHEQQAHQKQAEEKSKLVHDHVDEEQSFDRKSGTVADKSKNNNQDGLLSLALNSSNNQAQNLGLKEFTAKVQRLYFPTKEIESPRTTNVNEDLKNELEGLAQKPEDTFKAEYQALHPGENQKKLEVLMDNLDFDDNDIGALYQPKSSGPNHTDG